jgi:hypothetical protein
MGRYFLIGENGTVLDVSTGDYEEFKQSSLEEYGDIKFTITEMRHVHASFVGPKDAKNEDRP